MADESGTFFGPPNSLAKMLDLVAGQQPLWADDELGAILRHQLDAPLEPDLGKVAPAPRLATCVDGRQWRAAAHVWRPVPMSPSAAGVAGGDETVCQVFPRPGGIVARRDRHGAVLPGHRGGSDQVRAADHGVGRSGAAARTRLGPTTNLAGREFTGGRGRGRTVPLPRGHERVLKTLGSIRATRRPQP